MRKFNRVNPTAAYILSNPHLSGMYATARNSGLEMGMSDIDDVRRNPPVLCSCGLQAHYKPTVGTYICSCGKMRMGRNNTEYFWK